MLFIQGNDVVYKVTGNWEEVLFYMDKMERTKRSYGMLLKRVSE